jgi:hypothetical protein
MYCIGWLVRYAPTTPYYMVLGQRVKTDASDHLKQSNFDYQSAKTIGPTFPTELGEVNVRWKQVVRKSIKYT